MCDVLVLDDDPLVRSVTVEALEDAGLSVVAASCLREARAILAERSVCRVLMVDHDLGEPDRANGFDFAERQLAASGDVAAIYTTGRWSLLDERRPTTRERHLPKPFRLADVVRSVKELLER